MKRFIICFAILITMPAYADRFDVVSIKDAQSLRIHLYGDTGGMIAALIPYLKAAGAEEKDFSNSSGNYSDYTFPSDNSIELAVQPPNPVLRTRAYTLRFDVSISDPLQLNTLAQGVIFGGNFANTLYIGMKKSNAPEVGQTTQNDRTLAPIFSVKGQTFWYSCELDQGSATCKFFIDGK